MWDEYRGADYSNGSVCLPLPTMTRQWRDASGRALGANLLSLSGFQASVSRRAT